MPAAAEKAQSRPLVVALVRARMASKSLGRQHHRRAAAPLKARVNARQRENIRRPMLYAAAIIIVGAEEYVVVMHRWR